MAVIANAMSVGWTPSFLLKRYVLTGIRDGPHEPFIADSVDFVVAQVETLSRDDLASRLSLTVDAASVGPLLLSDSLITIMDTNDFCAIPQQLKDQVTERYPGARQAHLKSGGDFPFLSRPDEVNLHLQLHLRRVGVEARQDMVPGVPKNDAGGSSSNQMMNKEELTMHKMIEKTMAAPEMEANHLWFQMVQILFKSSINRLLLPSKDANLIAMFLHHLNEWAGNVAVE
ncbi:UNVERIFIED_CONTAM: Maspardin [Sesamum radiatum]|uniref:Maspardin n=1 Tax=Sesamum radiatum TaxID=300843 RepID=A0AAW2L0J1_SESRA